MINIQNYLQYNNVYALSNLSKAIHYVITNNIEDERVKFIFSMSDVKIEISDFLDELLIQCDKNEYLEKEMKRTHDKFANSPILWPYYALYWSMKSKQCDKIDTDHMNKVISKIIIDYHFYYLRYLKFLDKDERISSKSLEYATVTITRIIEFMSKFKKSKNSYLKSQYFPKDNSEPLMNFFNKAIFDYVEKDCFFISGGLNNGPVFLKYQNLTISGSLQIKPSRRIYRGKGDASGNKKNQNIVQYFKSGLDAYEKIVNLTMGRKKNLDKNKIKNRIYEKQYTEEELLLLEGISFEDQDNVEKNNEEERRYRVGLEGDNEQISDQWKQRLQNRAFSAKLTKNNLFLPSMYNIPSEENLADFISFIASTEFRENLVGLFDKDWQDLYTFVFLFGVITGMPYSECVEILVNEKGKERQVDCDKEVIRTQINSKLFGKGDSLFSEIPTGTISYEIPGLLCKFYKQVNERIQDFSQDKQEALTSESSEKNYRKFMQKAMDKFDRTIKINLTQIWRIALTYKKREYTSDISSLYCYGRFTTLDRGKLAYGSVHKSGQIHTLFLEKLYNTLNMHEPLIALLNLDQSEATLEFKFRFDAKKEFVGSKYILKPEESRIFFSKMRMQLMNYEEDTDEYFNLMSIYIRYALSILLGTRFYSDSCRLDSICIELKILRINEKSDTQLSGIRVIPLSNMAIKFIQRYKVLCEQREISNDNIYLIEKGVAGIYKTKTAVVLLDKYGIDDSLISFVDNVSINVGRHIITKIAVELNFNGFYLEAFLGHYLKGTEQLGIFSSLGIPEYIVETQKIVEKIAKVYGVRVI